MLEVSTCVDLILEDDRSPRYVLDLMEQGSWTRWTRVGKKLDDVIKVGGVMATIASHLLSYSQALHGMEAEDARYKPFLQKYKGGDDILASGDPKAAERVKELANDFEKARDSQKKAYRGMKKAMIWQGGASILGLLNLFQSAGRAIDKRKFRKAVQESMHNLMMAAHPEHRYALSRIVNEIASKDPFTDINRFFSKLKELMTLLRSTGDPRYEIHIESLRRFLM